MNRQLTSRLGRAIPSVMVLGLFMSIFAGAPSAMAAAHSTIYSVTYNGNGQSGGTPPADPGACTSGSTVTVLGQNGLYKTGYTFGGWATSGGLGPAVTYSPG